MLTQASAHQMCCASVRTVQHGIPRRLHAGEQWNPLQQSGVVGCGLGQVCLRKHHGQEACSGPQEIRHKSVEGAPCPEIKLEPCRHGSSWSVVRTAPTLSCLVIKTLHLQLRHGILARRVTSRVTILVPFAYVDVMDNSPASVPTLMDSLSQI